MIDKAWDYDGYRCEVRIVEGSHRCGYVYVDEGHPLHGVLTMELPNDFEPDVNGGITYAGRRDGEQWAMGFDYCHCWNTPDPAINPEGKGYREECEVPDTLANVVRDCTRLVHALRAYEGREYVLDMECYSERLPDAVRINGALYRVDKMQKGCENGKDGYQPGDWLRPGEAGRAIEELMEMDEKRKRYTPYIDIGKLDGSGNERWVKLDAAVTLGELESEER